MFCPNCKSSVTENANFCGICGAPLSAQAAKPPKQKPGCFVRLLKGVAIAFACLFAIGVIGSRNTDTTTPTATATPTPKVTATATPTATPKPTATPTSKPTATPKPTKAVKTLEQVMEEIRVELSDYDFCEVFMDDEYIIVDIASEGMTTIAGFVIAEPTETSLQMWEQIKQSTIDLSKAINKSNKESGVHNRCVVRLISEVDNKTILLSVSNDLVLFDVVNQ